MKIVFIAASELYPWGGSEYLWAGAAERLARRGVEVRVSVKDWCKPVKQVEELRAAGCRIFLRPTPGPTRRAIRKLPPFREYPRRHLAKIAAGADLVVVSQGSHLDGLVWMQAARANGYKYAPIAQAVAEVWWPNDDTIEKLTAAYEGACLSFFVSEANLALTRQQFVTPLRHARVIRNPFNVPYDARALWPSDTSGELRLASIGRMDAAAKGQDILFQTLALPRWRERNVRVSLFGAGINERTLRRWADTLNLRCVSFAGFSENIERIWATHHALILPSRWEGMPLVLVEAMLCGRPAIITDVAGARELVRDNVNGFLVKAPTVELLDEAMNRAWENRHRLKEMGEQAAIDVRKFVPPDPVEDFARELLALAEDRAPSSVQRPASSLQKARP
jgi:glycosyltransferase involved in cell wall biosynthesis